MWLSSVFYFIISANVSSDSKLGLESTFTIEGIQNTRFIQLQKIASISYKYCTR